MSKFICLIISILFVVIGIFMLFNSDKLIKRCTIETDAKVVEYKEVIENEHENRINGEPLKYTYYPIIEYKANDRVISKQYQTGSNIRKYKEGESIIVLYNPDNVEEFIIKGEKGSKILGIGFTALGGIAVIAVAVSMIRGTES